MLSDLQIYGVPSETIGFGLFCFCEEPRGTKYLTQCLTCDLLDEHKSSPPSDPLLK